MSAVKLPAGWTRVKLGDVAVNSTAVSSNPVEDGYKRYVLGKDIPDNGTIETWGEVGDGHFGSRIRTRIEAGDVICTTRGPNLRVARATFRALGAHTNFVLRTANKNVMLQDFLALIAESEGFQTHLVRNFRGSVNLFVNWSDAAKYEFALPPIDEQQRLVKVLSSFDKEQNSLRDARTNAAVLRSSILQALDETTETRCRLGDLVELERGASYKSSDYVEERTGRPFLNLKCVTRQGTFSARGVKWVRSDFTPGNVATAGELFFANTDLTPGRLLVGAPFFFRGLEAEEKPCFSMDLTRVRLKASDVPVELVYHLLNIPRVRAEMRRLTGGSTVGHLRLGGVPRIEVPVVSDVLPILDRLRSLENLESSLADHAQDSHCLSASVLARLLGGEIDVQ